MQTINATVNETINACKCTCIYNAFTIICFFLDQGYHQVRSFFYERPIKFKYLNATNTVFPNPCNRLPNDIHDWFCKSALGPLQEEKGISGNVTIYASVRRHDNPGRGTRNARGEGDFYKSISEFLTSSWCHVILVMAPKLWEGRMGFQLLFILQSDAMTILVMATRNARGEGDFW